MIASALRLVLSATGFLGGSDVVTVTTVDDVVDFPPPRTMAELPGPDGKVSFREAAFATSSTPGPQTIAFAIPTSDWWLVDDMAVLRIETAAALIQGDSTIIDFTTQTAFTGDTNPSGPEVGIYGVHPNWYGSPAIVLMCDDSHVIGLGHVWQRTAIEIREGQGNRVSACVTGTVQVGDTVAPGPVGTIIGGPTPDLANVLDEVEIRCFAVDTSVVGNELERVRVSGSQYCAYPLRTRIGGPTPELRNVISGFFGGYTYDGYPKGEGIVILHAQETLVEGNYVGVTPDGMARAANNGPTGIEVVDSIDTTIRGNLVAGIWNQGIYDYAGQIFGRAIHVNAINDDNVGVVIEGNLVGTDATGESGILTRDGIVVVPLSALQEARDVRIGGLEPGQGNTVAFTELGGVSVHWPVLDTEISGNSIHSNGLLGIDLAPFGSTDGVTANDVGDTDQDGGNSFQNFPVLLRASAFGSSLSVQGQLGSAPSRDYRIELFASDVCDPSSYGEGELFLGSVLVTTDRAGFARFGAMLPVEVAPGAFLTATATDLVDLATSEFSACLQVRAAIVAR